MTENTIDIESLDAEGRGVGHLRNEDGSRGKTIFVEGALPGERVTYASFRRKPRWEAATMTGMERESALRVKPACEYFGICGGCAMQHIHPAAQVAVKQRVLEDNLVHLGRVTPEMILRPIHGPAWGYRYRARLSVRHVAKKGGVLVGFRERHSSFIADMHSCLVLPPKVSDLLLPLRELIGALSIRDRMPQLELAQGDDGQGAITALVMRNMDALTGNDEALLRQFADRHEIQWWLQPKGPETVYQFYPQTRRLEYRLPEFGIVMPFKPTDFTQVNHQINRVLVEQALRLLEPEAGDRVADLFCGLGNFTLPLATLCRAVVGIEGSAALTTRAQENARLNGLDGKTEFLTRNLFEIDAGDLQRLGRFERMLFDPPRDGALALCLALADLRKSTPELLPSRIVYVSCSPSTLARDAGMLVHRAGYRLSKAGVVNMFPHTAHVESMAVFDLDPDFVLPDSEAAE